MTITTLYLHQLITNRNQVSLNNKKSSIISKRFLLSSARLAKYSGLTNPTSVTRSVLTKQVPLTAPQKSVHYHVDDSTAVTSSHELAQKNPILKKVGKNTPLSNSFQHPLIGRDTCDQSSCYNKVCKRPCGNITERVYIGHVTHSNQYGVFISYYDFNNKKEEQYFVPYVTPIRNPDVSGENINQNRTTNLNTSNTEARDMIHILSLSNNESLS